MAASNLPNIGAPATRALAHAGITSLADVASWTERDLLALHGVGPKAIRILTPELDKHGLSLRRDGHDPERTAPSADSAGVAKVEKYLAEAPSPQRETLTAVRATLREVLPAASEDLKYGMPTFLLDGKGVAAYASFKAHCGYFPMSSGVLAAAGDAVASYKVSKGGLRFAIDEPLPAGLIRELVRLRLDEIAETGH